MGYFISTNKSSFSIRTEDFSKFFLLVQELMSDESKSWFSRVVTADVRQACVDSDIRRVFTEWGYDLNFLMGHEFRLAIHKGTLNTKLEDKKKFFAAIAPVVVSGSFLDYHGENGEDWRWLWENGKFFSQKIVRTTLIVGEPIEIN